MSAPTRMSPAERAARREQLVLRSAQLREQLRVGTGVLRPAFRAADRVRGGVDRVCEHPGVWLVLAAALAGMAVVRPRLVMGLGLRAWSGWQLAQRARPLLRLVLRQLL
jgi:hypothetical protein